MVQLASDDAVKLQFVAAMDAWVELEHTLGKLLYVLLKPIPYPRAWMIFASIQGSQAQRETIAAVMEDALDDEPLKERISALLDRVRNRHDAPVPHARRGSVDPRVWCDHPGCGALGA